MKISISSALAAALVAAVLVTGPGVSAATKTKDTVVRTLSGTASWYGGWFHGRQTANGERYDMNKLTAAHKTLPFGTKVRVTNSRNGRSVVVRINDRGPFVGKRVIDLSRGAAKAVGMIESGLAPVRIEILAS
ncbi:MAG TPA: septal ring lytic transglycosylase RlpA family protein [Methylomirabilota bacterium]|nr:septal ring lytic transglycosylase RlpA family protein [Methylomirabilota bacterium]